MKVWKILAVASLAMTFAAAAQAQCGGHHASKSAEATQTKVPASKIAAAKQAVSGKLAAAEPTTAQR